MQVRRRPYPLLLSTLALVRAGKMVDPRKGKRAASHSPMMQGTRSALELRPTLFVNGVSYNTILEERVKAAAERDPRTVKIVAAGGLTTKVIPFQRYGRESAKIRAAGFKLPYGDAVAPGMTIQL